MKQAAEPVRALCDWAEQAGKAALPEDVRRRAALILCDDVAAMLAAADEPLIVAARAALCRTDRVPEATVFAGGLRRVSRDAAAAANGLSVAWAELDEGHRSVPCHAGAYILPALLAEAEADGHGVEETLNALAIAYEITVRVAATYRFGTRGVHPHAAFNAIGAAAGVAALRRYDARQLMATLTAAATLVNPGPFNHAYGGALVRNMWTSIGATAGLRAADFALLGIAGLDTSLHDVFVGIFGCAPSASAMTNELGSRWAVEGNYHKLFACCQYAHSAVEATLDLNARVSAKKGGNIASIEIATHPHGMELSSVEPRTVLEAKFSLPHIVAAAAIYGHSGAAAFSETAMADPDVARLRRNVTLLPHPDIRAWPNDRPAIVRWLMQDGSRHESSVQSARGGADQPFSEAEILAKIIALGQGAWPGIDAFVATLMSAGASAGRTLSSLIAVQEPAT